jgi:hypothetical protein
LAKIWEAAPVLAVTLEDEVAEPLVLELLPVAELLVLELEAVDEPEALEDALVEVELVPL